MHKQFKVLDIDIHIIAPRSVAAVISTRSFGSGHPLA